MATCVFQMTPGLTKVVCSTGLALWFLAVAWRLLIGTLPILLVAAALVVPSVGWWLVLWELFIARVARDAASRDELIKQRRRTRHSRAAANDEIARSRTVPRN